MSAAACQLPALCDPQIGCPDSTGCNWCGCTGTSFGCNQAACGFPWDGGLIARTRRECMVSTDCGADEACVHPPGCTQTTGVCTLISACTNAHGVGNPPPPGDYSVCDCNGLETVVHINCGVEEPYANLGACH